MNKSMLLVSLLVTTYAFADNKACSIQTSSEVVIRSPDQYAIQDVLNQFHCGLASGSTDLILKTYDPKDAFLLTNVPTDLFEHTVWPCKDSSAGDILIGTPIRGLTDLKRYQDAIFSNGNFHNVTSKIIDMQINQSFAFVITYGSHRFVPKSTNKPLYVQDTALWTLRKLENAKWSIHSVSFTDKIRNHTGCGK